MVLNRDNVINRMFESRARLGRVAVFATVPGPFANLYLELSIDGAAHAAGVRCWSDVRALALRIVRRSLAAM